MGAIFSCIIITTGRSEDTLCDQQGSYYTVTITIPCHCVTGQDPFASNVYATNYVVDGQQLGFIGLCTCIYKFI